METKAHISKTSENILDDLSWTQHINGKGGIISSLNQRLFTIKRLNNNIDKKLLVKVADSLFNSKIRYGLQLLGKVKLTSSDTQNQDLHAIQLVQNKMIRFLNNKTIKDRRREILFWGF